MLHRGLDLLRHQLRLRLCISREGTPHELLPQRLAEIAIDRARAGLPARRHLRRSAQGLRIEVEVGLFEWMRQKRRRGRQEDESADRRAAHRPARRQLRLHRLHELRLRDVQLRDAGRALHREVMRPVERRRNLPKLAQSSSCDTYCADRAAAPASATALASAVSMRSVASASALACSADSPLNVSNCSMYATYCSRSFTLFGSVFK